MMMILVPNKANLDKVLLPILITELDPCPLWVFPLTTLVIHLGIVVPFVRERLGHLVVRIQGQHERVRHRVDRLEVVKLGPTVQVQVAALLNPRVPAHATPNHSSLAVDLRWILVVLTHLLPSVSLSGFVISHY